MNKTKQTNLVQKRTRRLNKREEKLLSEESDTQKLRTNEVQCNRCHPKRMKFKNRKKSNDSL